MSVAVLVDVGKYKVRKYFRTEQYAKEDCKDFSGFILDLLIVNILRFVANCGFTFV